MHIFSLGRIIVILTGETEPTEGQYSKLSILVVNGGVMNL